MTRFIRFGGSLGGVTRAEVLGQARQRVIEKVMNEFKEEIKN